MSDGEDSMSEGFSASEDEWKPSRDIKGGESSDDDDSDFEGSPIVGAVRAGTAPERKRDYPKARNAARKISTKKRTGLSLRAKLYNKYRPPPKTSPAGSFGKNSPTSSTSRTSPKNAIAPNESKSICKTNDAENLGSSSDSSIDNYLVNPEDLDFQSSFFNGKATSVSMVPTSECNASLENLSDTASGDEKAESKREVFNFNNLLEYAKTLECVKEKCATHNAEESNKDTSKKANIDNLDVYAVLALGERQQSRSHNDGEDEDDEDLGDEQHNKKIQPSKLNKTKSTRIKRHTKTRPTSNVAANDTDESDWEEVADSLECLDGTATSRDSKILEIHVELPTRNRNQKTKTQQDIENAFNRKLNRDIKDRQVLLHKASLLYRFGRMFAYNRLLNNIILMQNALKLLPTKSAYPPERGTEIKYFQSMVTWFTTVVKLKTQNLYPEKSACETKLKAQVEILKQIQEKVARCKQDMIFIFIILLRGMGLQCRLLVNMQPLPLKPSQSELLTMKMKKVDKAENKKEKKVKTTDLVSENKADAILKTSFSKVKNIEKKPKKEKTKKRCQNQQIKGGIDKNLPSKDKNSSYNSKAKTTNIKIMKSIKQEEFIEEEKTEYCHKIKNVNVQNPENICKNGKNKCSIKNDKYEYISEVDSEPKTNKFEAEKSTDSRKKGLNPSQPRNLHNEKNNIPEELDSSQNENETKALRQHNLVRSKRKKSLDNEEDSKKPTIESGSLIIPKIAVHARKEQNTIEQASCSRLTCKTRSGSKSPQAHISTAFLLHSTRRKDTKSIDIIKQNTNAKNKLLRNKSQSNKVKISTDFLKNPNDKKRVLRSRQKTNEAQTDNSQTVNVKIPQLDGSNDNNIEVLKSKKTKINHPNLKRLQVQHRTENSDEDFEPSSSKKPKIAPTLVKQNLRVVSSDDENNKVDSGKNTKLKQTAGDMWLEVWSDVEEQWVCIDIFKAKIHCVDTIRKSASPYLAYVFAFQNDLSVKDVTARYCPNWTTVIRKSRVDKAWLDTALCKYLNHRTKRDIKEDHELRRMHEKKPMPTAICDYKNHPFYALKRHLLKFEALYPLDAPALGYIRGEPVYSRDCVHTLHSREIWLKQARTVKLAEKPYKIVKARPKWDRITQTVIKDIPLEIFGYWQTQDYEPPTAENGLVPRNAYGNVELFKLSMLPKKTKHVRLPGLNRICKKLGIDCANAVVGFDFHQGACHPTYDGFVICEEFEDQVVAAWHQDQEEQELKEQEKYEARVYANWKKLIRGLLIRERLKLKYNF